MSSNYLYDHYGCRRLHFLLDLFTALNLTPYSFGQKTEPPLSTAQALRSQLKKDDMRLSRAKQIVSMCGYKLDMEIKDRAVTVEQAPGATVILPESLRKNLERSSLKDAEKNKNLSFLRSFLSRNRISHRKLALEIGKSAGAVEQWLRSDDISISYLFAIKEAYQVDLVFSIGEKDA